MCADELRDLVRRAANVTGYRQILVLGSQAVHGALPDVDLPTITTTSEEADLAVFNDLSGDTPHQIEAPFGMGSPYHQHFGVYADGISLTEVTLPRGWEGRLRTERITEGPDDDNPVALLFPEVHDLCASKLIVAVTGGFGRRSDREFVGALIEAGLVDTDLLMDRIHQLPDTVAPQVQDAARGHRPEPPARHLTCVDTGELRRRTRGSVGRLEIGEHREVLQVARPEGGVLVDGRRRDDVVDRVDTGMRPEETVRE